MSDGFGTKEIGEECDVVMTAPLGGPRERHEDRLGDRADLRPISAATGLPVDHRVAQLGLRRPVRSLRARLEEKAEQVLSKGREVVRQAPVGRIAVDPVGSVLSSPNTPVEEQMTTFRTAATQAHSRI